MNLGLFCVWGRAGVQTHVTHSFDLCPDHPRPVGGPALLHPELFMEPPWGRATTEAEGWMATAVFVCCRNAGELPALSWADSEPGPLSGVTC